MRMCSTENSRENSERAPVSLHVLKFSLERVLFCILEYYPNAKGTPKIC